MGKFCLKGNILVAPFSKQSFSSLHIKSLVEGFLLGPIQTKPELLGRMCKSDPSILGAEDIVVHYESGIAFIGGDHFRSEFFPPLDNFNFSLKERK